MASFEWLELQSLTHDISESRSRLSAARAKKDLRLARQIEEEIGTAEQRRTRLLARISSDLATDAQGGAPPEPVDDAGAAAALDPTEASSGNQGEEEEEPLELVNRIVDTEINPMPAAGRVDSEKGDKIVWDQLSQGDIERAKQDLIARRAEILARHVEELKALDADQVQLDSLEHAIGAFLRKFNAPSSDAAVVKLDEKREIAVAGR